MKKNTMQYDVEDILLRTLEWVIVDGGYISKGGNSNSKTTIDKVKQDLLNNTPSPQIPSEWAEKQVKIVEFFKNITIKTDYDATIKAIASVDAISWKQVGACVSMVQAYDNMVEKQKAHDEYFAKYGKSDYVGVQGKRKNWFLKLIEKKKTNYEGLFVYTFVDRQNNLHCTWVTPEKDESWDINLNDCVDLDATVKGHKLNKFTGVRETWVNRLKIIDNMGSAQGPVQQ